MAIDKARAKAADPAKSETKTAKRRAADGLVMLSMALATVALCIGLVMQAGLGFWAAVPVSGAFYLGLLSLHTLVRRHEQLDELHKEVAALRGEVQMLRVGNPGAVPQRAPAPAAGPVQGAAPAMPPPHDPMRASASSRAVQPPAAADPSNAQVTHVPHGRAPSLEAPAALQPPVVAPIPAVVRAPDRPDQSASGPAGDGRGASPALGGINRVPRRVAPDLPAGTPDGTPRAPVLPAAAEASVSSSARPQASVEAPAAAVDEGYSPRESDVEMIHGLIKKLADEVNATEPPRRPEPRREAFDAEALDESVEALRKTASTMRAPQSTAHPAGRVGTPEVEPPVREAPSQDADLDVEALMRRAQPIATMASMPPPLPSAPVGPIQGADAGGRDGWRDDRTAFDVDTAEEVSRIERDRAAEARRERPGAEPEPSQTALAAEWDGSGLSTDDDLDGEPRESDARMLAIADALEAGRVDVFLEPILDLEKQQPRHYEVSLRLRDAADGAIDTVAAVSDADDGSVAVLAMLDSLGLTRTAQVAKRLGERGKQGAVFSTFNGSSLTADGFLTAFADTYDAQQDLSRQLVLTFAQADVRRFRAPHWTMLGEMRDLGFAFAVRAVTDLDMDFGQLSGAGFKFVKLDTEVFLRGLPAPGAMVPAVDIARHLDDEGLAVVVEAIDDDAKRARVASYGVELGQGALFGGPRLMKAAAISGERSAA